MSLADFLFNGKPPPSVTTYGSSTQNLPQWLSDYTQGLIARSNSIAAEPYTPYTGPRIAGFTADQKAGQEAVRSNVGSWRPGIDQASGYVSGAEPYLQGATERLPQHVQEYMDPYVDDVINRSELEANRNFNDNIMPGLSNKFTSLGQYGSSAHEREANRAALALTEGLQSQSLAARSRAYENAGTQFSSDQNRQLQAAQTSGQLGSTAADIAKTTQGMGYIDAQALGASGAEQQGQNQKNVDLAYQDFINQRDYPRNQASWLTSQIKGAPTQTTTTESKTGPMGNEYQPTGIAQLGSILAAGKSIYDIFKAAGGRVKYNNMSYRTAGAC